MASPAAVSLRHVSGPARTVDDLTTLFDLCLVVVDVRRRHVLDAMMPVIERIDRVLSGSDCTVGALAVGGDHDEALAALGPMASQLAVFVDPDGASAQALGVQGTPALIWITTVPEVAGLAHGWDPPAWKRLLVDLARSQAWARPLVPAPGDPSPFPALPLPLTPPVAGLAPHP